MKPRVLVETSVLVHAAVHMAVHPDAKIGEDHSLDLILTLKPRKLEGIGIITPTIMNEAFSVIEKAILDDFKDGKHSAPFEESSAVLNRGTDSLRDLIAYLSEEHVKDQDRRPYYVLVCEMYDMLKEEAEQSAGFSSTRIKYVSRKFRSLAKDIYREQAKKDAQLHHLLQRSPSPRDQMILAEAAYFAKTYTAKEPTQVYLASRDKHFSPKVLGDKSESRRVTDEISKRFKVVCCWPETVLRAL